MLAGGIFCAGFLNLIYFPFYWKFQRRLQTSRMHQVPLEPYPEEIVYGMNADYIQNSWQPPAIKVSPSQYGLGPPPLGPTPLGPKFLLRSPKSTFEPEPRKVAKELGELAIKNQEVKRSREVEIIEMKGNQQVKVSPEVRSHGIKEREFEEKIPEPLAVGAGAC